METSSPGNTEWIDAEDSLLNTYCDIKTFPWGRRYLSADGPTHHKFNFIRVLDNEISQLDFDALVDEQTRYYQRNSRPLCVKIGDSLFPETPKILSNFSPMGTPLVSVLVDASSLSPQETNDATTIKKCENKADLELFIAVNASAREWPLARPVYNGMRASFTNGGAEEYYLLFLNGEPACTTAITYFNDKFNSAGAGTHKNFQRLGLFNYMKHWIAHEIQKDFYVQLNEGEASFTYCSKLLGAKIVNTEYSFTASKV